MVSFQRTIRTLPAGSVSYLRWQLHFHAQAGSSSVAITIDRLSETEIWHLRASEQDSVFPFLAQLLTEAQHLQAVFGFASQAPELRSRLVVACLVEGQNRNLALHV